MKAYLKVTIMKVKAKKFGRMEAPTVALIRQERKTAMANMSWSTDLNTKENGKTISSMELVPTSGSMAEHTKDNGNKISFMGKVFID